MQKFTKLQGLVAPMDRENVDTDAIIPKQFLKSIKRSGFGPNLFDEWRYLDVGQPNQDNSGRPLNQDFVLNFPRYAGAQVLLARENFGCGSSREHAPWALADYGLKAVIAPSFADIFYGNSLNNGLLVVRLTDDEVDALFKLVEANEGQTAVARAVWFNAPAEGRCPVVAVSQLHTALDALVGCPVVDSSAAAAA